jgi:integrase
VAKASDNKSARAPATKAPISKRVVDEAEPGPAEYVIWDDGGRSTVKGFGLKVTPAGSKVYIYRYRVATPGEAARKVAPRKVTLGKHGDITADQARARAKALAADVTNGIDPLQAKADALAAKGEAKRLAEERARLDGELTFEKVATRWLEGYELDHRPASVGQARVSVGYMLPKLRTKPMPTITRADLQAVLDAIPAQQKASRQQVYAYMSILWRWALERGDIAYNPVPSMAKPKGSTPRDRVLADDELAVIWQATDKIRTPLGAFYRVLLLTGQRREEVAGMDWAELDRASATWIIPASRAKNGVAHIVPLVPAVLEELDRLALARHTKAKEPELDAKRWPKAGPVMSIRGAASLSCFSQAKRRLDAEVTKVRDKAGALPHWRVHDLRRTMATGFQRLGVRFEVTEATLNHVSGAKGGVAGIYQKHDWKEEKRLALDAWARHVVAILKPAETGKVVSLDTAKRSA